MPITTIYFVRHAESDHRIHDEQARPLTPSGLAAAEGVTSLLADREFAAVYSSPYVRAVQTVSGLAAQRALPVITVADFRERRPGAWLDDFNGFIRQQWADFTFHAPEGESLGEVQARNVRALREVITANRGRAIAVGTHGTALGTILNAFDRRFGYDDFRALTMPDVHVLEFDAEDRFVSRTRLAPVGAVAQW